MNESTQSEIPKARMEVSFTTHCTYCGTPWAIAYRIERPDQVSVKNIIRAMRVSLEKTPRTCCGQKPLEIDAGWEKVWQ